ncbi:MAG: hypothetical protein ACT4PY_09250 [Armatimonadota bacterium]
MSARQLRTRTVGWGLLVAGGLVAVLILVTWKAASPLLFLLYPILVLGVLALLAMAVLWALRHF